MSWAEYRRTSIAEMRPYVPGECLDLISVGALCKALGGPREGDMVARDPRNHKDQWIVVEHYFRRHFAPLDGEGS